MNEIHVVDGRIKTSISDNESISASALNELFDCMSAANAANVLEQTVRGVGMIAMFFHEKKEPKDIDMFKLEILSMLPTTDQMFQLYQIAKLFKS